MEDFSPIIKKPLNAATNVLNQLAKKEAASMWGQFKRNLSTASEPILRKNMGERYLSASALSGGLIIWIAATIFALAFPSIRSFWGIITLLNPSERLWNICQIMNNGLHTFLVGAIFIWMYLAFGKRDLKTMGKYREEGVHHHTQSRGVPRWKKPYATLIITGMLFLFNLPAFILFMASRYLSSKMADEQQAAIYSRYLDALDQKIEQEYLENAILGKCPTEITQLCRPLPVGMKDELRKNIAAAAIGKQVTIPEPAVKRTGAGVEDGKNVNSLKNPESI